MEQARDHLHLRWTTDQHMPEVEVQVKYRTAALNNQECQLYLRHSQQQQVLVVDFQAKLRQVFITETPRCGKKPYWNNEEAESKQNPGSIYCLLLLIRGGMSDSLIKREISNFEIVSKNKKN
ncbi:putative SNURF-like protein [Pan paniscus]|uniref:putative SNURF-like protein n=1 Tax=Pan paniscus TaxID=9597 RepID=UPI00020E4DF9|nr:putative SNURF-like protein [Pan paniscus]